MDRDGMKYVLLPIQAPSLPSSPSFYLPLNPNRTQVGAPAYRQMRWEGKTPLAKPVVLPEGVNGSLPSREAGREIPYRVFKPSGGVKSKGIHMHIHGGGWVLMSEA